MGSDFIDMEENVRNSLVRRKRMQMKYPHVKKVGQTSEVGTFIRRTYNIFLISIVGTSLCGVMAFFTLPPSAFIPLAIADAVLWIVCGWFGWRRPIELVFLLFTVVTGSLLGMIALRYAEAGLSHIFLNAAILTILSFVVLSIYVHMSQRNFSGLIGFLTAGFFILLGGLIVLFFIRSNIFHVGLSVLGTLVFSAWVLFDTSCIIHRSDSDLTPAIAAFELYLDLMGLFSYVLDLLDMADN